MMSEELHKAIEFPACIAAIVSTLATLAFPFVSQEVLSDRVDTNDTTHLSIH